MSLTYSIDHLSTSVEDVSVEVADKSSMILQSTITDPKTGEVSAVYVLPSGDNAYPATITYRSVIITRGGKLVRRISVTFSTWATKSDSVTGLDTKEEVISTFTCLVPATMTIEVADFDDLLGNLFSFLYLSVTAKARDTSWAAKLLYGLPQVK